MDCTHIRSFPFAPLNGPHIMLQDVRSNTWVYIRYYRSEIVLRPLLVHYPAHNVRWQLTWVKHSYVQLTRSSTGKFTILHIPLYKRAYVSNRPMATCTIGSSCIIWASASTYPGHPPPPLHPTWGLYCLDNCQQPTCFKGAREVENDFFLAGITVNCIVSIANDQGMVVMKLFIACCRGPPTSGPEQRHA